MEAEHQAEGRRQRNDNESNSIHEANHCCHGPAVASPAGPQLSSQDVIAAPFRLRITAWPSRTAWKQKQITIHPAAAR